MSVTFKVVNGDVQMDSATGRPILLADRDKFRQDVRQTLEMERQPNGTGAGLESLVGLVSEPVVLRSELMDRISRAFAALKRVQERIQRQDRTPAERFRFVTDIRVSSVVDPATKLPSSTTFAYGVRVASEDSAEPVTSGGLIVR